jgi:hypothetical protein
LAYVRTQYACSVAHATKSLALARTVERASYRTFGIVWALVTLGHAESKLGATTDALSHFKEALMTLREASQPGVMLGIGLEGMAAAVCASGDLLGAARLFRAADSHWQKIRVARLMFVEVRDVDARHAEAQLGEAVYRRAWNEGRSCVAKRAYHSRMHEAASRATGPLPRNIQIGRRCCRRPPAQ